MKLGGRQLFTVYPLVVHREIQLAGSEGKSKGYSLMSGDGWGVVTYQRDIDSLFHDILRLVKKKATGNRGKCRVWLDECGRLDSLPNED
ncbi:hypothetical protein DZS_04960 [Dickeya ananatis]